VPDLAERWELGLNMNRESTDRDKFDDGQELFGLTKWGWGALPRAEDTGYVFAEMPSWVKAPGHHPLVAAFPVPEIDVVESSLHVQTVTTVTTDHTIGSGTERSYSTAKTEGTSTSLANTVTWNEWQEVSVSTPIGGATVTVLLDPTFNREVEVQGLPIVAGIAAAGRAVMKYCTSGPTRVATCLSIANSVLDLAGKAASFVGSLIGPKKQSSAPAGSDPKKDQMDKDTGINACMATPPMCMSQAAGIGYGDQTQQLAGQRPGASSGEM
jgi:hypothetical protein